MADRLEAAVAELEDAARRLREEDLDGDAAAELVERCARLAAEAAEALERRMRAEPAAGFDDQMRMESS
jgi:hypothetical protein